MVSPEGSGGVLEELEEDIRNINALASIIQTVRCQVDLSKILDCQAYDATVRCQLVISQFVHKSFVSTNYCVTNIFSICLFQHVARLEALLEESHTLSSQNLHDSGVRTLCISELRQVDLDKVVLDSGCVNHLIGIPFIDMSC